MPAEPARRNPYSGFILDIFGNDLHLAAGAEAAHVQPFAENCHKFFQAINRCRLDFEDSKHDGDYQKFLYGFSKSASERKTAMSDFISSSLNVILMFNQSSNFDNKPSVMFIPLVTHASELWGWTGDSPLEFLVICRTADTYLTLRAHGETISCQDQRVRDAFNVYEEVMTIAIALVCHDDSLHYPSVMVEDFRKALRKEHRFQSPRVLEGTSGEFLRITMGPALFGSRSQLETLVQHPSPDPISLMCRSFNAFSSWLYSKNQLQALKKNDEYDYCKLFPSCSDDSGDLQCGLCIASHLLHGPLNIYLGPEEKDYLFEVVSLIRPIDDVRCKEVWRRACRLDQGY